MATFIKGLDCACPDCTVDPCTTGCHCFFQFDEVGNNAGANFDYDVTGEFTAAHSISYLFNYDTAGGATWTFTIKANGSAIFSSGALSTGSQITGTVTVPSGTTALRVEVGYTAGDIEDTWDFVIICDD